MNKNDNKRKEFKKLYLTGKCTQKAISQQVGITEKTAGKWVKEVRPTAYLEIRNQLTNDLQTLVQQHQYEENNTLITQLISNIERIDKLILKHYTNLI